MRKCTADQIDSSWATRGSVQARACACKTALWPFAPHHWRALSLLSCHSLSPIYPFGCQNNPTKQAIVYLAGRWFWDTPMLTSKEHSSFLYSFCPGLSNLRCKTSMQMLHTAINFLIRHFDSYTDDLNIILPFNFRKQRYAALRKKVVINLNLASCLSVGDIKFNRGS